MNTNVNEKRPVNKRAVVKIVIWSVVFCLLGLLLLSSVTGVSTDVTVFGLPGIHLSLGGFTYEDANEYSVGNASVKGPVTDLEIVWLAGDITVIPSDTDEIIITEDYSGDDDDLRLRWLLKDSKLTVQFRKPVVFGKAHAVSKNLTVAIPAAVLEAMDEVEITTVSGDVTFTGNADELTLDAVEGDLTVKGDIGELEVNAVKGKLTFTGGVRSANMDCVDTSVIMHLDMATELSFDQVNGDVELYLSEEITGFTAEAESLGGGIRIEDFSDLTATGDHYTRWGDGSLRIQVNGVNAKLTVKKATND